MRSLQNIQQELVTSVLSVLGQNIPMDQSFFEIPPDTAMGDVALPCFRLASFLNENPVTVAIHRL